MSSVINKAMESEVSLQMRRAKERVEHSWPLTFKTLH